MPRRSLPKEDFVKRGDGGTDETLLTRHFIWKALMYELQSVSRTFIGRFSNRLMLSEDEFFNCLVTLLEITFQTRRHSPPP